VHEFYTNQRVLGCCKRLETEHGPRDPLHASMVLFHNIIKIFCALPERFAVLTQARCRGKCMRQSRW
jgi:hypothetical protein